MPDIAVGHAAMVGAERERRRVVGRIADVGLVEAGIDAIGKKQMVDVAVARLPEFGRRSMHDGENIILAQRVGERGALAETFVPTVYRPLPVAPT